MLLSYPSNKYTVTYFETGVEKQRLLGMDGSCSGMLQTSATHTCQLSKLPICPRSRPLNHSTTLPGYSSWCSWFQVLFSTLTCSLLSCACELWTTYSWAPTCCTASLGELLQFHIFTWPSFLPLLPDTSKPSLCRQAWSFLLKTLQLLRTAKIKFKFCSLSRAGTTATYSRHIKPQNSLTPALIFPQFVL